MRGKGTRLALNGLIKFRNQGAHGGGLDAGPKQADFVIEVAAMVMRYLSRALTPGS